MRNYKRKLGSKYGNFEEEDMVNAIDAVVSGQMKQSEAANVYKVNRKTLSSRLKITRSGREVLKAGGQPVFSEMEEKLMTDYIVTMGQWGFPVSTIDLRSFAKCYLDRRGRRIEKFKNNFPSEDWALSFLKRKKDLLSQRTATNICRNRAAVGPEVLNEYFHNLEITLREVPPENIINYDETNAADDPGKKKVICKKGQKYVTRILDASKASTSVMFSGTASGVLLPPYVVYKAEHLYNTWKHGGPQGAPLLCPDRCCRNGTRFNRSHSGWFDSVCFEDYFEEVLLPHCSRLQGRKVIIGDNLSSHFNDEVLRKCKENNIAFVCLPANATHLTQPLDVSFFRPLKQAYRKALEEWKLSSRRRGCVPKDEFPVLLKNTLQKMGQENIRQNLISGFKTTGIFPIDRQQVLKRIPSTESSIDSEATDTSLHIQQTIESILAPVRFQNQVRRQKRKRISVAPGKSVATAEVSDESGEENFEQEERSTESDGKISSDEEENVEQQIDVPVQRLALIGVPAAKNLPSEMAKKKKIKEKEKLALSSSAAIRTHIEKVYMSECHANDFLVAVYDGFWWIGRVEEVSRVTESDEEKDEDEVRMMFLHPHGPKVTFHWPEKDDLCWIPESQVLGRLVSPPEPRGTRNFCISSDAMDAVEDLFLDMIQP